MLAVDPRTFERTAFWQSSFADESLGDLVGRLRGAEVDGRLPVVARACRAGDPRAAGGDQTVSARRWSPRRGCCPAGGRRRPWCWSTAPGSPTSPARPASSRTSELWTNGPEAPAATRGAGGRRRRTGSARPGDVFSTANFLGISWTFGYLSALAVFVGVIAVGGLLLYLEARSRTRVSGYVMARRLGLGRAAHLRSLVVELSGVALAGLLLGAVLAAAAVAVVYRRLDVDPLRPPTPLLDVPWLAVLFTAVATAVVAMAAAAYAQRAADRADPATVLREDA